MKTLFKITLLTAAVSLAVSTSSKAQDNDRFDKEDSQEWKQEDQARTRSYHYESKPRNNKPSSMFKKKDFGLILGVNNFDKAIDMPELNQWQSRYVALQWRKNHKLITGRQVDVALGTGLEVGWYNFMMKYDEQYFEDGDISDFELLDREIDKSKLVVNNLNIPVMLQFGFKESDFRVGFGAYAGVRINSYQKFKEFDGAKFKEKGDYNLNKFNYGLMAEAGKGDVRFFAKYDMSPLFNTNNPINANVFTFGLRL